MIKRPMKGDQLDDLTKLRFPVYGSPKIDGFRLVLSTRPLTSRLSPFPNRFLDKELSGLLPEPLLDGEVVVGSRKEGNVLRRTSSGVTSRDGEPDFTLWCFDTPQVGYGKRDRLRLTQQIVRDLDHPRVRFLKHQLISDLPELERYIADKLDLGYEGVMVSAVDGIYKFGKSTLREQHMLKIKPFTDFEFVITGYYEQQRNDNEAKREATGKLKRSSAKSGKTGKGTLGGFTGHLVSDPSVTVRVGGGFTDAQRKAYWERRDEIVAAKPLGKAKKQTVGEGDRPRHPNWLEFLDFRPSWDMAE